MTGRAQGPWGNPGFLLWRVTLKWQREVAAVLRPLGLTHPQFVVLASTSWLGRHGSPPSQRELADHTGMDAMTASQVARTLETKKLITRAGDPHDTRVKRLHVTPDGLALARQAIELIEAVDDAYFAAAPDHAGLVTALLALAPPPDLR
ncbi:MarR family transcriptional regulator [Nonomuraea sp. NPDC049152]|uniref:MarR family winged helix-turn-helix transcriptional regulator n=1 Tax=Nonomuraea sp. NPDC049152 TaxID=3154350 RepID=UPI0033C53CA1